MKNSPVKNMAYWKGKTASTPNKFMDMLGSMGGMMGGKGGDAGGGGGGTEFTTTDAPDMKENVDESKQSKVEPGTSDAPKGDGDGGGSGGGGGKSGKGPATSYDLDIHGAQWNP